MACAIACCSQGQWAAARPSALPLLSPLLLPLLLLLLLRRRRPLLLLLLMLLMPLPASRRSMEPRSRGGWAARATAAWATWTASAASPQLNWFAFNGCQIQFSGFGR